MKASFSFLAFLVAIQLGPCPTLEARGSEIHGDTLGVQTAYVTTPHLYRYDVQPDGATLRLVHRFEHLTEVLFRSDTLVVVSELVPWADNRVSLVNTRTGRWKTWEYENGCDSDGGFVGETDHTAGGPDRPVVYWGCTDPERGPGYALDLRAETLRREWRPASAIPPVVWTPPDAPIDSSRMLRPVVYRDFDPPPPFPPAGYTESLRRGPTLAIVRDTTGAVRLWDGARLFPLDVPTVLLTDMN